MAADERTPLIGGSGGGGPNPSLPKDADADAGGKSSCSALRTAFKVENRILLAGFLITLSFSFTQVP